MQVFKFFRFFGISFSFAFSFLFFGVLTTMVMAESKSYAISYINDWNVAATDLSVTGQNGLTPQIALNNVGQAIAIWSRSNGSKTVIQYSYSADDGDSWSTAANLSDDSQNAVQPQVAINASGRAIAIWRRFNGSKNVIQAVTSADGGINWSSATNLSDITKNSDAPQIAINASGQAIAIWHENSVRMAYSVDGGINWLPATFSSGGTDNTSPQVAINSSGQAIAVWDDYPSNAEVRTSYSINGGASWSTSEKLSTGEYDTSPQVTLNDSNQAMVVWDDGDLTTIKGVYSSDGGLNWSSQQDLSADGVVAYDTQVDINSAGQIVVIWTRYTNPNYFTNVISSANGSVWTSPDVLSSSSTSSAIPQIAINDSNRAVAVWYRRDGSNNIIQESYSTNGGATWISTKVVVNLSAAGQDASAPQVALNSSSVEIPIWIRSNGSNTIVQVNNKFSSSGTIFAEQKKVRFPLSIDLVNEITWTNMLEVTTYKVYADAGLTQVLGAYTDPSIFFEHQMKKGVNKTYYFTVTISGSESSAVAITLP